MMMTKILLLSLLLFTLSNAESIKDQDMDGVPDDSRSMSQYPFSQ